MVIEGESSFYISNILLILLSDYDVLIGCVRAPKVCDSS